MHNRPDEPAWVFVSHASADLPKVREVRNFMEERGAAPILFHLKSLTDPERFWPLIVQEIEARNFFLLCDSEAARASAWVQRERQAVAAISRERAIRIGRVSLDEKEIDYKGLERFLLHLQVFIAYPASGGYEVAARVLKSFGYNVSGAVGFSEEGLSRIGDGSQMSDDMIDTMYHFAARGWLLVVMNKAMATSARLLEALPTGLAGGRVMLVLTDPGELPSIPPNQVVGGTGSLEAAMIKAAQRMLMSGTD